MLVSFIFSFHPTPTPPTCNITLGTLFFGINNLRVGMSWYVELPISVSKNKSRQILFSFYCAIQISTVQTVSDCGPW